MRLRSVAVIWLIALLGVVAPSPATATTPHVDIVGGTQVPSPDSYPFVAALVRADALGDLWGGQFCGGSLIAPNAVLTAAHCVASSASDEPDEVVVSLGRIDLSADGPGEIIGVAGIIVHHGFVASTLENDIAILVLDRDAEAGVPIDLVESTVRYPDATEAIAAGWGATRRLPIGTPASPKILREVTLPVVSDLACGEAYASLFVPASMLCAGLEDGGADSCSGDSGGPLFVVDEHGPAQIGVVSWGIGCARPGLPGVYAEVAAFAPWILANLDPLARRCDGLVVTLGGSDESDELIGTPLSDVIDGGAGDDVIRGGGGGDVLCGGSGDDEIHGGAGDDVILGGDGSDRLYGDNGRDVVDGGRGRDRLFGGAGADTMVGGGSRDRIFGGAGNDAIRGGRGPDALFGGRGADAIWGGPGDDRINGGHGHDRASGGIDDDVVFGYFGDDLLIGGPGFDVLVGGGGVDVCLRGERVSCE